MYLTIKQASEYVNIKTKTLYSLASNKQIPHYRIGKMLRFSPSELDAWMLSKKVEAGEAVREKETAKKIVDDVLKSVYNPRPKKAGHTFAGKEGEIAS